MKRNKNNSLFDPVLLRRSLRASFTKLDPRQMIKNPIMFTVEAVTFAMLLLIVRIAVTGDTSQGSLLYNLVIFAVLLLTVLFANFAEAIAEARGRAQADSLRKTREETPAKRIEPDGQSHIVNSSELKQGDLFECVAGDTVAADGEIVEGASTLNTAALTGESLPRDVMTGDEVISGCINMTGVLKVKTTKAFGESTVSKILELMENSSSHKSRSEAFISRFARVYTPAVCYSALALAILPPVINLLMGNAASWGVWVYRALTFLVISCPCALVISIPLSFFAGLGGAGHEGILIKGSNYLEALSKTKIVVFDKTGTLTQGVFEVTGVHHSPMEDRKLLEYAALAECASSHPISKSLQKACGVELDRSRVTDIEERSGRGVVATVDGHSVAAGNGKLMEELGVKWQDCRSVGTIVHMAVDGEYAGHIVISRRERDRHRRARCHRRPIRRLPAHRRRGQTPQCRGHPGPEGRRSAQDRHAHGRHQEGRRSRGAGARRRRGPRRAAPGRQGRAPRAPAG